jgi:hypothetical protein
MMKWLLVVMVFLSVPCFAFLLAVSAQEAPKPPQTPLPTAVEIERDWLAKEHDGCRKALSQIWFQGNQMEQKARDLQAQVDSLLKENAQLKGAHSDASAPAPAK